MPILLVRYGEIGLKSTSVRRRFEQALVKDISRRHALARVPCVITSARGRLFVDSDDWRRSCEILSRTFGVVSFSPVTQVPSELGSLVREALEFAEPLMFQGAAFAVRARRTGNQGYKSQDVANELGAAILSRFADLSVKVSLDEPDVEVFVEVRDKSAYLYSSVLRGPGGMPLGTQGTVLSVVDSVRGLASTWLMMKRGCDSVVAANDEPLLSPLSTWAPDLKVVQQSDDLLALAEDCGCSGIALPWSLADLERRGALKAGLPVFYPLIGMTDEEVDQLLARVSA